MYCDQRSQYIRPKVTVHKGAETIQRRKLLKGGNYMRKYGMPIITFSPVANFGDHTLILQGRKIG